MPVLSLFSRVRTFALALSLAPVAALAQSGSLPVLPEDVFPELKQILAEAVQQSPRMLSQSLNQEIAAADLISARSGLYPSAGGYLQASVTRDRREGIQGDLSTDKLYYSFSITQPLFHWGERRNNAKIGEISKRIADRNYGEAYRLLAHEIRVAYLQMIILKGRVAEAKFNLEQAQETLRVTEDRLMRGVISESEAFQPRIAAEQSALNADKVADSFAEAKRRFAVLTGRPAPVDERIPDEIPPVTTSEDKVASLLGGFLSQSEPLTVTGRTLRDQVESAELTYANQRSRLRPKINLVAGLTQDEQSYTIDPSLKFGLRSFYAGVSVNWTVFDGFATKAAKRSSLARVRQAEATYRQYAESVASDAQRNARQLSFAARQLSIQERLFDSNRNFLNFIREQRSRGLSSDADVTQAQVRYNSGLLAALEARADYLLKSADFVGLVSEDPNLANLGAVGR